MFESIVQKAKSEQELYDALRASLTQDNKIISPSHFLWRAATLSPETVAIIFQDQSISFRDLFLRSCAVTRKIRASVRPGDRVIIAFENSPEFYITYFAAWQAGAVVIPLNIFLKGPEIYHVVNDAKPVLIITAPDRVALFKEAGIENLPPILNSAEFPAQPNAVDELTESEIPQFDYEALAALLYTSGTTGQPKGVMLSAKNIITNVLQVLTRIRLTQTERVFAVLPLFHAFAQCAVIWGAMLAGCTVVLVPKIDRRMILRALKHKPTVFLGVPALYGLMCLLRTADFDSIKFFASGGDALSDKIRMAFALIYRRKICSGFGMTEASPVISWDLEEALEPTDAAGKPLIGVEVQIRSESGALMPHGAIGAIWVRGDNVMMGYYNAPEQTAQTLVNGWLDTGDLGYINEHGRIVITGRLKDLIKHKGFNIYPQEIENVIAMDSNVVRVGVIGVADNTEGEIPVAYVQLRTPEVDIESKLEELCKKQLAMYKVPRKFVCSIEELPLTVTGKVDKKVLRKK